MTTGSQGNEVRSEDRAFSRANGSVESLAPPLFVGGTGGSGTRAVVDLLHQAGMFIGARLNASNDSLPLSLVYDRHLDHYLEGVLFNRTVWCSDVNAALVAHLEGAKPGARWLAKNPRSILMMEELFRLFPDAQFLHVARNGVDMAFSSNQRQLLLHGARLLPPRDGDASRPAQSLRVWAEVNRRGLELAQRYPGRCAVVRYEDFCTCPRGEMERIGIELGLHLENAHCSAGEYLRSPRPLPPDWREQLGSALGDAAPMLRTLGYPC